MFIFVTFLYFFASTCSARPDFGNAPKNMITAPTNCPVGQQWVNGQCREVWRVTAVPDFANMITVPTNCPEGQELVNGVCRDVWLRSGVALSNDEVGPQNVVTVPTNCKPGQQWVNGECRDVWRSSADSKNVIQVPTNCPPHQQYINGQCRDVWRSQNQIEDFINNLRNQLITNQNKNVISVPNQCPIGYKPDALGNCRKIM